MVLDELVLHDRVVGHLRVVRNRSHQFLMDCVVCRPTGEGNYADQVGVYKGFWVLYRGRLYPMRCLGWTRLLHSAIRLAPGEVLASLDLGPGGGPTRVGMDGPRP